MAKLQTCLNDSQLWLDYNRHNWLILAMDQRQTLIALADILGAHQGVTHFAISMRALGKGDFFKNMKEKGADCRTQTAARLIQWFSDHWPADLEWPRDIPRPSKSKKEAA